MTVPVLNRKHSVVALADHCAEIQPKRGRSASNAARIYYNATPSSEAVLLILNDPEIRGLLRFGLKQQGFCLLEASRGAEGIEMAGSIQPGSVLLDLDVEDPDGPGVIKKLREFTHIPILALAGRINQAGAVDVLDGGASDFISRPFNIEELSARLRAARRYAPLPPPEIFRSGSLIVDLTRRIVKVGERIVNLSATEYSLLHLFIRHAGLVLTHAQILREIWGSQALDKLACLRVYLLALRKKLENPPEPTLFLTEQGVGYRLAIREA